ncbi:unnamed protein product [Triticum turgidum subsp. durum]|uniref:Fungal lipase-like domain-containing protein n=3 Tax=Triticum TaxID=4564 RepID=A0A9R0XDD2_TRITD|nr:unnamed protein product [Triticum turgidum subsp. durum]
MGITKVGPLDTEEDTFHRAGPTHMMSKAGAGSKIKIDWSKEGHRRCVMSCLVKATYVMENDILGRRLYNNDGLAPAWWESFGFRLVETFVDDSNPNDKMIFGATFELMALSRHRSAPRYVVAFRGTMLGHYKRAQELMQDCKVIFNELRGSKRFEIAHPKVHQLIGRDASGVWLTGHSLGASLALDIGRDLMEIEGHNIRTFLFNPPHVSAAAPIDKVLKGDAKTGLYTTSFMLKFALGQVMGSYRKRTKRLFERLNPWVPDMYVNRKDIISMGHIEYFEQRQQVAKGFSRVAKTGSRLSYRDMFHSMFGAKTLKPHLLPSARLNSSTDSDAHSLRQWWKPDSRLSLSTKTYSYPHG